VAAGLAVASLGCGAEYGPEDNPTAVRDVTGVEFGWSCKDSGCKLELLPSTPPPDPCPDPNDSAYNIAWGRFFEVCSVCVLHAPGAYWGTTPGQCRLLACDTDADCPAIFQYSPEAGYACVGGLCQNVDTARYPRDVLNREQVEQLCLTELPRADTSSPFSQTTMEVLSRADAACPDPAGPCQVPAGCRMP
jgi:hypothetical protein